MNNFCRPGQLMIAAAFFISCCFVCACENKQSEIDVWIRPAQIVDKVQKVEIYFSEDGKMKSKVTAPLMLRVQETDTPYIEFPNRLHAEFFDDSTKVESWLDSRYGKYFENLNKVYLRDSVVVISVKGDTLRCHDLWWDQTRGLFYTDSVATYSSVDNNITGGKGMEATQDFKSVTFRYPLGTVNIGDSGFAE